MSETAAIAQRIEADLAALRLRAEDAERGYRAACAELAHVLEGLPYAEARTGKYKKLRRRLERFLGERLEGL